MPAIVPVATRYSKPFLAGDEILSLMHIFALCRQIDGCTASNAFVMAKMQASFGVDDAYIL